jgi:hypothetical protein
MTTSDRCRPLFTGPNGLLMARTELRGGTAVSVVGSDDQSQAARAAVDHDEFVELAMYAAPVVQRAFAQRLEAVSASRRVFPNARGTKGGCP